MAKFVFTDASITVDGTDLSSNTESVTMQYQADAVECTTFGDSARSYLSGLTDGTVQVTFFQDYDASSVDAILFPLVGAAAVDVVVKPTSGAAATTNPEFTVACILTDYSGPVDASVGDAAQASATFQMTEGITRATS